MTKHLQKPMATITTHAYYDSHLSFVSSSRRFGSNTFSGSNFVYSSQFPKFYCDPDQCCDKSGWGEEKGEEGEGLISASFVLRHQC